jgi:hypothetical protein
MDSMAQRSEGQDSSVDGWHSWDAQRQSHRKFTEIAFRWPRSHREGPGGRGDDNEAHGDIYEARGGRELTDVGVERAVALGAGEEGWGEREDRH